VRANDVGYFEEPASEGGLYNDRFCPVARLAASTCGDPAKRARFIVPLPVP